MFEIGQRVACINVDNIHNAKAGTVVSTYTTAVCIRVVVVLDEMAHQPHGVSFKEDELILIV